MNVVNKARLTEIMQAWHQTRVLVIGDLILDGYIWGEVERISPEAPVPVVRVTRESFHPGGAANVVANIRCLGGEARVIGVLGADAAGDCMKQLLEASGVALDGLVTGQDYASIKKTRVIARRQQVVRVDREDTLGLSPRDRKVVMERVHQLVPWAHGVVASDYGKGMLDGSILRDLTARRPGPRILVDPKDRNFNFYRDVDLITPNQAEAERMAGIKIRDQAGLMAAAHAIFEKLRCRHLLITRGEHGMALFQQQDQLVEIPTQAREVFDVSGAGDTVIATMALSMLSGATPVEAAVLSNIAAGIVVGKLGTASTNIAELERELARLPDRVL